MIDRISSLFFIGYRTVIMARLASIYYNIPGIQMNVLGPARNNLQIYTETNLELALENGNIDVGFFYECEQIWTGRHVRFIPLPMHLDMSNKSLNYYYAKVFHLSHILCFANFVFQISYEMFIFLDTCVDIAG